MANQKEYPIRFTPRGLSDAWDSTDAFPGACRYLTNLIFAQTDPELVVARPGVGSGIVNLSDSNADIWGSFTWGSGKWSSGFLGATFISAQITIGNLVYGMVSCTIYGAFDVPFCYDLNAQQYIAIGGPNKNNLPTSPATSGEWVPPSMAVVGDNIIITHEGYSNLPVNSTITASITGSELTVTAVTGSLVIGSNITGVSVPANTVINGFVSGKFGGAGIYTLNNTVGSPVSSETMTASTSLKFGVINIGNPQSPFYYGTDLGIFPLPSVPTAVANFNNRAYFACGNSSYYSDILFPTQASNAGQALTHGDPTPIQGYGGLPIQTTSSGVVGALTVFKEFQIWQVTGDAAITGSLSQNYLSLNIGTKSPRSIVQTPVGLIFASIDGPYFVSPLGQVLPLTKDSGKLVQDVQRPFQNIIDPSRAAAAFTGSIYRICMQTVIDGIEGSFDYWFDVTSRRWNGPHSFQYDCASQAGNYFVISGADNGAVLWESQYIPNLNSVYNDNGVALSILLQSSMLPKTPNINEKQVIESTVELATASAALAYTIQTFDDHGQVLGSAQISIQTPLPTWGNFTWGDGSLWSNSNIQPWTYQIPWSAPLVFKKLAYKISATSSYNLAIGTVFSKYRDTGFTNVILPWNYTTPTPPQPIPNPPQSLFALPGNQQTNETWSGVYNATSYNLYWSLTQGSGTHGSKITGLTSTFYNHTGLTNGDTYYYVVTAVNSSGESSPSNESSATPTSFSVYVCVDAISGSINQYDVNSDGTLVFNSSALIPFNAPSVNIATSKNGSNIYATASNSVYQLSRDELSSVLSFLIPPSVSSGSPGSTTIGVAVHPSGNWVYSTNFSDNTISQYSRSYDGLLSPLSPSIEIAGSNPYDLCISPDGKSVYVCNYSDNTISQYDVGFDGVLSPLSPSSVSTDPNPQTIRLSKDGNYLYSANISGNSVSQFSRSSSGQLTSLSPSSVHIATPGFSISGLSVITNYVYVSAYYSGGLQPSRIYQFKINSDGTLSSLFPAYVSVGVAIVQLSASSNESYLYATDSDLTEVFQFSIGSEGQLSPLTPDHVSIGKNLYGILAT